jgi:lon-related putative ATP-dependent protease
MTTVNALEAKQLYKSHDLARYDWETTEELEELKEILGQSRAVEAMRFGMGIDKSGYNIFALGPAGIGKRGVIRQFFEERAAAENVSPDWCYVHNFDDPHRPKAIRLPAGRGMAFRDDMDQTVEQVQTALSAAFEAEEYQARRQEITQEFRERQSKAFEEIQERAQEKGLALLRTPAGLIFAPAREGEVLSPDEVRKLPEEERKGLESEVEDLQEELQKVLQQMPAWQREMQEKMNDLNREISSFAVGGLIDELREKYSEFEGIVEHLNAVQEDVIENARDFLQSEEEASGFLGALRQAVSESFRGGSAALRRYQVNLLVDHSESQGAPVFYEDNPTYQNLVGRVEHMAQMGALLTDFNLIQPGALHKANGGYLILDARKVLTQPYSWEGLKRALQAGEVKIESVGQMLSLVSTVSLEPQPIPLDVKVALVGERLLYYLLWQADPDFADLFKVEADFEDQMDRNSDNQLLYARLIATLAHQEGTHPLNKGAVGRFIEHSARLVGDSEKLTTHMRDIRDLLRESDYWAGQADNGVITVSDVQKAIDEQIRRADRIRDRLQEEILRDTILIDTEGKSTGQVNGLSVIQLGNFAFARPTRITAQLRLGKGEVVDIEREVELGGPIHSKGVLILAGFLGARYAKDRPLSLSASLVFEQSYGGVEGDSASSAELYALLSAIAEVPLRQDLAVTGSVNQHGRVQAIGGVNEKIEGFFDVCKARGLTGEQGVLIPASNVKHLMLRQDVVEAASAGQFRVYPVETIDQGIELLTGLEAGEPDAQGNYPEGTINYLVESHLAEMAENLAAFSARAKEATP